MQKLKGFLQLIRIQNLFIIALSLSLFYYLVIIPVHNNILQTSLVPFSNTEFIYFVLSVVFLAAAGNVINDYFDYDLDKEFKPGRPLPLGLMSLDTAMYLHMFLVLAGIGLGFYLAWKNINFHLGYVYVVCALLLYVYSAFLKKVALVGNIVVAGLSSFVFVLLVLFDVDYLRLIHAANLFGPLVTTALDTLLLQMKFYAGFAFLTSLARELVKDIEDYEGDSDFRIGTFAVEYGKNAARWLTVVVLLILISGIGYFVFDFYKAAAWKNLLYLSLVIGVPVLSLVIVLVRARETKDYSFISSALKVVMLLGILSIPVFYLSSKLAE